mmetsp:Transcript_9664/g.21510  ORF Transcript_9664/g.21510 Transcript_9664/m.21510 type:complete len:91 (+) Transcript_9664:880-1152(+)
MARRVVAESTVKAFLCQTFVRWKAFLCRQEAVDTTRCPEVPGACPIAFGTSTLRKKVPAAGKKPPKLLPVQAWELVWTRGTRKQMDRGGC